MRIRSTFGNFPGSNHIGDALASFHVCAWMGNETSNFCLAGKIQVDLTLIRRHGVAKLSRPEELAICCI